MLTIHVQNALPGYKKVNPMVYCGIVPGRRRTVRRSARRAGKLQLNDASLFYEPETSAALGFGFRCGFLGLLHLEIIQERLEREYNLDLVTTAPSVIYKVHKTDGTVIDLTNPSNLPDPSEIDYMEEPLDKSRDYGDDRLHWTDHGALPAETRPVSGNGIHGDDACDASLPSPAE